MSLGKPEWLWALLVLPFLVVLFVYAEQRANERLTSFIAPKLLPTLAATVNRFRRALRFAMLLIALGFAIVALAQPRWGYTFDEVKRRGLDVLIAVDTSRSMLSNDVQPNRLQRVKLAAQDFVNALQGDRVGLIAFAGRAFVQAPLTIDYSAAIDAVNDLDTNTIPEGGTNISEAINLAVTTFGKSAIGNRALVIFTDGEELNGDALKVARAASDSGVRIFTIGVGTPEGSLIPIRGDDGGTAFVKDDNGQVVKSRLDEKRLREIAQETGGIYLHLENGPATMRQLVNDGLSKMQAGDIDARLSRRPIERYQWPLGAACIALASWFLISERKRVRVPRAMPVRAVAAAAALMFTGRIAFASAPGIDAYRSGKFNDAFQQFDQTLKQHPQTSAADKLQFDAGAAAYKLKDYAKALDSFSQALLSKDAKLQALSHYNLGNTLYERGETQQGEQKKMTDWTNALQHYDEALKLDPQNKEAKENYEFVKNKIEELKQKQNQPTPIPSPTPTPSPSSSPQKKDDNKQQQNQQQQQQQNDKQKQQDQQQQQQDQQQQSEQQKRDQQQSGGDKQKQDEQKGAGQNPTPSPSPNEQQQGGASPTPSPSSSPSPNEQKDQQQNGSRYEGATPTPSQNAQPSPSATPSPSAGEGSGTGEQTPSPAPSVSPGKNLRGEVKGADAEKPQDSPTPSDVAEAEPEKEGEMSPQQAEALLRSMKDEEKRVQLDERKAARHVYKDW